MTSTLNSRIHDDIQALTACCWETASLDRARLAEVQRLSASHIGGAASLLESCQRVEVYLGAACECDAPQRHRGIDALRHLAEVAAGLHSVVLGEEQILGQVRAALAEAPREVRAAGDIALAAARELRRETEFDTHSGHLLDRALRLHGIEAGGTLLILGTGQMGRLVARRGLELGFESVIVAGRREPDWTARHGLRWVSLEDVRTVGPVHIAVGCLGSGAGEVDPEATLPPVQSLLLDLGTPRNFAQAQAHAPLATIAALHAAGPTDHSDRKRARLRERLHAILDRRLKMAASDSGSAVGRLRAELERTRRRELERIGRLHPDIAPETLDVITRSLVNQLFHTPSKRLRELGDADLEAQFVALFAGGSE